MIGLKTIIQSKPLSKSSIQIMKKIKMKLKIIEDSSRLINVQEQITETSTQNYEKRGKSLIGFSIQIDLTALTKNQLLIHLLREDFPKERDLPATLFDIPRRWEA